jgi:hypothetical protein
MAQTRRQESRRPPSETTWLQRMSLKGTLREALRAALDLLTFYKECEQADPQRSSGGSDPQIDKSSNGSMCMGVGPLLGVATSVGIKCGL